MERPFVHVDLGFISSIDTHKLAIRGQQVTWNHSEQVQAGSLKVISIPILS